MSRIQDFGVKVWYIPGGCTSLCQPVDIGYNKPFKTCLQDVWEQWMVDQWGELTSTSETPKPSRVDVAEWVIYAHVRMPKNIILNAWTKMGYAWYDKQSNDVVIDADVDATTITDNDDACNDEDDIATTDDESNNDTMENNNDHDNTNI